MNVIAARVFTPIVVALFLCAGGCAKQRSTMGKPPEVNPLPAVEQSAEVRVDELGDLAKKFIATAERLPGRNADEHRQLTQQAFADLSQILPVLFGPNSTGAQRQQLKIVENARTHLAGAARGLAPEPTIDTALRSARDALASLGRGNYFDRPQLAQILDRLDKTVADLDSTRGPQHQQVVAETVDLLSRAVTEMSRALDDRLRDDGSATKPAE